MYRVKWESKITGFFGFGNWSDDYDLIANEVSDGNKKYPEIHHRIETKNA